MADREGFSNKLNNQLKNKTKHGNLSKKSINSS